VPGEFGPGAKHGSVTPRQLRLLDEMEVMTYRNRVSLLLAVMLTMSPILTNAQETKGQEVIDGLEITPNEWAKLRQGDVVTLTGEEWEQTDRELAVDSVILVDKPLDAVLAETLDDVSLVPQKKILDVGKLAGEGDFAGVDFDVANSNDVSEAKKLLAAKAGKSFNLSKREIAEISQLAATLERNSPDSAYVDVANQALRNLLAARYRAYLADGLNGLEPYARSKKNVVDAGTELRLTNEQLIPIQQFFPAYYDTLVNYPASADCCEHSFLWMKVKIAGRPIFALVHRVTLVGEDFALVTERYFYSTHSLNSLQVTVAWLPFEDGTYMGLATSASADILSGFKGKVLRAVGRDTALDMVGEVLTDIRDDLDDESVPATPDP
jgi:hypothetical protein